MRYGRQIVCYDSFDSFSICLERCDTERKLVRRKLSPLRAKRKERLQSLAKKNKPTVPGNHVWKVLETIIFIKNGGSAWRRQRSI